MSKNRDTLFALKSNVCQKNGRQAVAGNPGQYGVVAGRTQKLCSVHIDTVLATNMQARLSLAKIYRQLTTFTG